MYIIGKKCGEKMKDYSEYFKGPNLKEAQKRSRKQVDHLKDAFEIIDEKKVKGKKFILLDDVITTGATLKEGVKVLKKHGAIEIKILTLAKSYI